MTRKHTERTFGGLDRRDAENKRNSNKGRLKMALGSLRLVLEDTLSTDDQRAAAASIESQLTHLVASVYEEKRCPETGATIPAKSKA